MRRALRLARVCVLLAAVWVAATTEGRAMARPKPPFKVLFSNDTTNILTCTSPYHKKRAPFRPEMIEATVDEVTGADVHMLQPGLGWIPWWKSTVYPFEDHCRWWMARTGQKPGGFDRYMLEGGDIVKVFLDRCREKKQTAFVSLRLNDGHHLENVGLKNRMSMYVSRFYVDHPEYRIGSNKRSWDERVLNWAVPAVREHKLAYVREICETYDIAGFELDFMRHASLFRQDETTRAERAKIVAEFVRQVRAILDRTAKPGQRRWLCARVPCLLAHHDRLGIDLKAMVAAGLDMVNLSAHYFTQQHHELAKVRAMVPGAAVYLEMTHCTTTGPSRKGYDSFSYRRTTDSQFYTTAHVAYRRGADGMSLFNFVYFREHGTPGRGPFDEPPFHVLAHLGDPAWLARQPQCYVLANAWHAPLPKRFRKGDTQSFALDMAPTEHQAKDGLVRLMKEKPSGGCGWEVTLNGRALAPVAFVRKPLPHPYKAALGQPEQYACFACPRGLVRDGANELAVRLATGAKARLTYIELTLP